MKKFAMLAVLLILVFTLTACGSSELKSPTLYGKYNMYENLSAADYLKILNLLDDKGYEIVDISLGRGNFWHITYLADDNTVLDISDYCDGKYYLETDTLTTGEHMSFLNSLDDEKYEIVDISCGTSTWYVTYKDVE